MRKIGNDKDENGRTSEKITPPETKMEVPKMEVDGRFSTPFHFSAKSQVPAVGFRFVYDLSCHFVITVTVLFRGI